MNQDLHVIDGYRLLIARLLSSIDLQKVSFRVLAASQLNLHVRYVLIDKLQLPHLHVQRI